MNQEPRTKNQERCNQTHQSPGERTLRQFAGLCLLFFGGQAVWHGLYRGHTLVGVVLGSVAAVIGLLGYANPLRLRGLYVGWMTITHPIGWLVSHVLLACMFYGLFTPLGMLFRMIRRDCLRLRLQPDVSTYWEPKPGSADVRSYFRQF